MNSRITLLIYLACISALPFQAASVEMEWLLPNFANRLSVEVKNPGNSALQALATLPVVKAQAVAPNFPGRLALAVLVESGQSGRPAAIIASQSDDFDGDGIPDEFEFPIDLPPHSQCRVDIYYSTTLEDTFPWPKRVSAKTPWPQSRGRCARIGMAGYRTYGGFLDLHGRKAGAAGLWNAAAGFVPVQRDLEQVATSCTSEPPSVWAARPGVAGKWLCAREQGAASTSVLRNWVEPGVAIPRHLHDQEEIVVVEQGEVWVEIDGVRHQAGPGQTVIIPPRAAHAWGTLQGKAQVLFISPKLDPFAAGKSTYLEGKPPTTA